MKHVVRPLWLFPILLAAACGDADRGTPPERGSPARASATDSLEASPASAPDAAQAAAPGGDGVVPRPEAGTAGLLQAVGGRCGDVAAGEACFAGDYDLELAPGCGDDGFFAGVGGEDGAVLLDRAPPDDTVQVATLSRGQFVCIEAIARAGQDPAYYYVTAIPVSEVEACAGNALCQTYGDREVRWHAGAARTGARTAASGRASGWVDADALDVFSNGLAP